MAFSGGARNEDWVDQDVFRPVPGSIPATDDRLMLDEQGRRWRFSGYKSFVLSEVGGFHNRLEVSACQHAAALVLVHWHRIRVKGSRQLLRDQRCPSVP